MIGGGGFFLWCIRLGRGLGLRRLGLRRGCAFLGRLLRKECGQNEGKSKSQCYARSFYSHDHPSKWIKRMVGPLGGEYT